MDDNIKFTESLEYSDVLIDGFRKTVQHEIEKLEAGFPIRC